MSTIFKIELQGILITVIKDLDDVEIIIKSNIGCVNFELENAEADLLLDELSDDISDNDKIEAIAFCLADLTETQSGNKFSHFADHPSADNSIPVTRKINPAETEAARERIKYRDVIECIGKEMANQFIKKLNEVLLNDCNG